MRATLVTALLCTALCATACNSKKDNGAPKADPKAGNAEPSQAVPANTTEAPVDEASPAPTPIEGPAIDAALVAEASQGEGQSFKEGMEALCKSINMVDQALEPADKQRAVAKWLSENVTNPEVRELFTVIGQMPPKQRASMMTAAATKAGLASCAIAEK